MTTIDLLQRFIFEKAPVRGEYIHLHTSFQTIIQQHAYPPAIQQLLGEALCVAGLLSAIIKFNGRLTVQFRGNGKLKLLLAQCNNHFQIRGLVKWEGELTYNDLMDSFNHGVLVIMLDSGPKKSRYQGIVSWRGNSLVDSIEGYFRDSEQLATKIWLSVHEKTATGFLLQVIPGEVKPTNDIDEDIIHPHWERIIKLTSALENKELLNLEYQTLLNKLYPNEEIRVFSSVPVAFQCSCSRKRGEEAIFILGQEEAEAELKNNRIIVVTCDFCNKEYFYDHIDITKIFEDKDRPSSQTSLH